MVVDISPGDFLERNYSGKMLQDSHPKHACVITRVTEVTGTLLNDWSSASCTNQCNRQLPRECQIKIYLNSLSINQHALVLSQPINMLSSRLNQLTCSRLASTNQHAFLSSQPMNMLSSCLDQSACFPLLSANQHALIQLTAESYLTGSMKATSTGVTIAT